MLLLLLFLQKFCWSAIDSCDTSEVGIPTIFFLIEWLDYNNIHLQFVVTIWLHNELESCVH